MSYSCGSSKPHVSWQEPFPARGVSLPGRYSARCYSPRQGLARDESITRGSDWDTRVDPDRQSFRSLSRDGVTVVQPADSREGVNLAFDRRTYR